MKRLTDIIVCLLLLMVAVGCTKTDYITIPEYHTDTTYITQHQYDSIYLHDSTYIKEKGDSVWVEKWHTKYVVKEKTDTLYKVQIDSVPKPYPVVKEVPADLTWWQTTRIYIADILLWVLLIGGVLWFIKKRYF